MEDFLEKISEEFKTIFEIHGSRPETQKVFLPRILDCHISNHETVDWIMDINFDLDLNIRSTKGMRKNLPN